MTRYLLAAVVLAAAAPAPALAQPDPLVGAIRAKARTVLEYSRKKGYKHIGVLKFLVRDGEGEVSDDVGELNLTLANQTEDALILVNDPTAPVGILDHPSEVVAKDTKLRDANHLTADGRQEFFRRTYALRWSKDVVKPAAFLVGTATVTRDLRVTIVMEMFDESGRSEKVGGDIDAPADPELLAQAGKSYTDKATVKALASGGPPPSPQVRREQVRNEIKLVADRPEPAKQSEPTPFAPLLDCPVEWTVLYDGRPVAVTGNRVPEPAADAKVAFRLRNPTKQTFGVVLLVNGDSTLFEERAVPRECRKWVLVPGTDVTIRGFQVDADKVVPFRVPPPDDPNPDAVRYGEHAGTYRLVVFHGTTATAAPKSAAAALDSDERAEMALARRRGSDRPGAVKPQGLEALQATLRGRAADGEGARGYVTKGKAAEEFQTEATYFVPSGDLPVSDISLRYYAPRN